MSIIDRQAVAVAVAGGNHITCTHMYKEFQWTLLRKNLTIDALLITLGSCDMVLGFQWLGTLGLISWDFKNLVMEFVMDNEKLLM